MIYIVQKIFKIFRKFPAKRIFQINIKKNQKMPNKQAFEDKNALFKAKF